MHANQNKGQAIAGVGYVLELIRPNCLYSSLIRPAGIVYGGLMGWFGSSYSLEYPTLYYFFTSLPEYQQRFAADIYVSADLFIVFGLFCVLTRIAYRRVQQQSQHLLESEPLLGEKGKII